MTRLAVALAALGTFLAGGAAMAWYLTRWHDDRKATSGDPSSLYLGDITAAWARSQVRQSETIVAFDDEPGGGWER